MRLRSLALTLAFLAQACGGKPTEVKPQEVPFWHSARYQGTSENETSPLADSEQFPYRSVDFYVSLGENCALEEKVRIIWCSHLEEGDKAPIWHSYDPYVGYDCKTLTHLEENRAYGLQWVRRVGDDPYQIEFRLVGDAFKDRTITVYSSPSTDGPFLLNGAPANDLLEDAQLQKKTPRCDVDAKADIFVDGEMIEAKLEKISYIKHESGLIPEFPGIHILGYDLNSGEKVQEYIENK